MKIIFITTYKARDFEGQALIGWYLKKKYDIDTFYSNGYDIWKKVTEIKPALVIMDHLVWDHKKQLAKWLKKLNIKVILLFTEGHYKEISVFDKIFGHPNADKLGVSKYLTWNKSMNQRVKDLGYSSDFVAKFKICGNPRFDFLVNPPLKKINYENENLKIKYQIEDYDTIVTYLSASPYQGYPYSKFYNRYKNKAGYTTELIQQIYSDNQLLFKNHTAIIRELAIRNPNIFFFYKTHPSEAYIRNYDKIFKNIRNVKIIVNEKITPFLTQSDLIIQRNSTAALEAWITGTPVIQLDDYEYNNPSYPSHNKFSYHLSNVKEIDDFIKKEEYKKIDSSKNDKELHTYLENIFYKLDGKAYIRVAKEIIEELHTVDKQQLLSIELAIQKYIDEDNLRLPNRVKDFFRLPRSISLNPKTYVKKTINLFKQKKNASNEVSISESEVNELYKKLDQINLTIDET